MPFRTLWLSCSTIWHAHVQKMSVERVAQLFQALTCLMACAGDLKRLIKKTAEAQRTLDEPAIWSLFSQVQARSPAICSSGLPFLRSLPSLPSLPSLRSLGCPLCARCSSGLPSLCSLEMPAIQSPYYLSCNQECLSPAPMPSASTHAIPFCGAESAQILGLLYLSAVLHCSLQACVLQSFVGIAPIFQCWRLYR